MGDVGQGRSHPALQSRGACRRERHRVAHGVHVQPGRRGGLALSWQSHGRTR
jgi:hypothetical protein